MRWLASMLAVRILSHSPPDFNFEEFVTEKTRADAFDACVVTWIINAVLGPLLLGDAQLGSEPWGWRWAVRNRYLLQRSLHRRYQVGVLDFSTHACRARGIGSGRVVLVGGGAVASNQEACAETEHEASTHAGQAGHFWRAK